MQKGEPVWNGLTFGTDYRTGVFAALCAAGVVTVACVTQQPPTDVAESVTGPSPVSTVSTVPTASAPNASPASSATVAYVQDLQPIFQSDCLRCHSGSRPDGNYSMSTYAQVLRAVTAGNARSALVVVTQRNASMYRYWSGNATAKAELVRKWVVENGAAQTR
jgi:hypothetical protein